MKIAAIIGLTAAATAATGVVVKSLQQGRHYRVTRAIDNLVVRLRAKHG